MTATLKRLVVFAGVPARRLVLSALVGVLVFGFGVALMTSAGYLISRAAEQPPILSLTATIVAVRFFALSRPIARYLERLGSSRWLRPSSTATGAASCSAGSSATSTRSRDSTCAGSGRRSLR
jgi:hypothetical protein